MSDDSKNTSDFDEALKRDALLERKKKEVLNKELVVRERRADNLIEKIERADKEIEISKKTDYSHLSDEDIAEKQRENTEYMAAAKSKMSFINESFSEAVPFFRKNLILIGAPSGTGKSTTVANIVKELLGKVTPEGHRRRTLVITNEEESSDVYNRVTCLIKGWNYVNHDKFTSAQVQEFNKYIQALSKSGILTVIDDKYNGAIGSTSTVEGICQIFDNLLENGTFFDAIIIDYYQNINESKKDPTMGEYEVQSLLASRLDKYKNAYPAPIVLLAQIKQQTKDGPPFKERIEGRKKIYNVCTCAIEMVANPEERLTEFHIKKSRFNEAIGKKITTGYDSGRYVVHDENFIKKVEAWKASIRSKEVDKTIGFVPEVEKEEEKV